MDGMKSIFLNLHPVPPRNRNPFKLSFTIIFIFLIIFLYIDISFLYRVAENYFENENILKNIKAELEKVSKENRKLDSAIAEFRKKYKKKVDIVNNLIEEKSLSWLSLLSIFEESLSDKTVLISLNPSSEQKILNAEIMSEELDELLKSVRRISENPKVSKVKISRETEKEGNRIFSIAIKLKE